MTVLAAGSASPGGAAWAMKPEEAPTDFTGAVSAPGLDTQLNSSRPGSVTT